MKKGFTLIELLAVIAILAIIATITAPIILNVIRNARIDAFENDANSLIRAANNYYAEATLNSDASVPLTITFEDKKETTTINGSVVNERVLDYSGQNPDRGELNISKTGKVSFVLYNDAADKCAVKNQYDKTATILDSDDEGCTLNNDNCFITMDNPDGTV